jgi:hypothetical protein
MSSRAALIARVLGVALALAWLSVTQSDLLAVFGFAVPFWIAMELEVGRVRRQPIAPARSGCLLTTRARPTGDASLESADKAA